MMNYDDNNDTFTVSLTIEDSNDTVTKQFTLPYDEAWTSVMSKVADGLSAYYGYDIKENLRFLVKHPEFHSGKVRDLCVHKHDFEAFMEEQSNL